MNEISLQIYYTQMKFQNTQRNFETLNETSLENSFHQTKYLLKFRAMFRTIRRNIEHVKTIALRNFFETSKNFGFLRNIAGFRLYSSKFALITFAQYCTLATLATLAIRLLHLLYVCYTCYTFYACYTYRMLVTLATFATLATLYRYTWAVIDRFLLPSLNFF